MLFCLDCIAKLIFGKNFQWEGGFQISRSFIQKDYNFVLGISLLNSLYLIVYIG